MINLPDESKNTDIISKQGMVVVSSDAVLTDTVIVLGGNDSLYIQCGLAGSAGKDGLLEQDVKDIVTSTLHGNANDDAIAVDGIGNIRVSIGTLQSIP